jgi:biopolymer transport protein ExbB
VKRRPGIVLALLVAGALAWPALAAEDSIRDLGQLLDTVKQRQQAQQALNRQREQAFLADRDRQQQLLQEARQKLEQQQRQNQPRQAETEANSAEIARLEKELEDVVADMGDLSSTFREFAGDFAAALGESLISAQYPQRGDQLQALANADSEVTIEEIQQLWLALQTEMTEASRIARFPAEVVDAGGTSTGRDVLRVGAFTAWADGDYLRYVPETGELLALDRQPPSRYRRAAEGFTPGSGVTTLAIDPTGGSLLGMLSFTPDLRERLSQGGSIGIIILALGAIGALLTLWRLLYLLVVSRRIRRQLATVQAPSADNPLGRVLLAVAGVSRAQEDLLQLKLDEAVLAEIPALERGNGLIKLFAATSPLLGLLGTVTGMILTFQAISLFGTGDPKLMAGGISQALVTTVLGLVVAIPLLFGHSVVAALSRAVVQRLDEQCAGVLARSVERQEA